MTRSIAMWSGPRNVSTALMRSWENRADCAVIDEPLYAFYLSRTGIHHPGREQILQAQPQDWQEVAQRLIGAPPNSAPVWYQKHMVHHLLPEVSRQWLLQLEHCFLIRKPEEVLSSYLKARPEVRLEDLGFVQQSELFHWLHRETGQRPVVIDSQDLLQAPEPMLRALCTALDLPFDPDMLCWPAGPRDSDGVWAPHWYGSVEASTGFKPYQAAAPEYPSRFSDIVDQAHSHYQELFAHRLQP